MISFGTQFGTEQCPPCSQTCMQGRQCPARRLTEADLDAQIADKRRPLPAVVPCSSVARRYLAARRLLSGRWRVRAGAWLSTLLLLGAFAALGVLLAWRG